MECLITLVILVSRDSNPENRQLLNYTHSDSQLQKSSSGPDRQGAPQQLGTETAKLAFVKMLHTLHSRQRAKRGGSDGTDDSITSTACTASAPSLASGRQGTSTFDKHVEQVDQHELLHGGQKQDEGIEVEDDDNLKTAATWRVNVLQRIHKPFIRAFR